MQTTFPRMNWSNRNLTKYWYGDSRCFMRDISDEEKRVLNATWNSLPDFGSEDNAIAVVDISGSMYCAGKQSIRFAECAAML